MWQLLSTPGPHIYIMHASVMAFIAPACDMLIYFMHIHSVRSWYKLGPRNTFNDHSCRAGLIWDEHFEKY